MASNILVCKVGGSLFGWPEFFPRLTELLARQQSHVLLISGGGPAADLVREWDRRHGLGEVKAHRVAIRSMRLGEALLRAGLPNAVEVQSLAEAQTAWKAKQFPVLKVEDWLASEAEAGRVALPVGWDVTSDSIAAVVARQWKGDLLLVKSTTPERSGGRFVDCGFAEVVGETKVEWCNLRTGELGSVIAVI